MWSKLTSGLLVRKVISDMLLEVKVIKVMYDKVEALHGVSIEANEGSLISIIGSNGAGKTTILRTISGLQHPISGEIWFQGERIDTYQPARIVELGIAHVPEGRGVFPHMTVYENLMMGAFLRKDKRGIRKDLEVIYERFPILRMREKQLGGSLSGGEQQMLSIARALMSNPKLLLMDEPSMGLSPKMVGEIGETIANLHQAGVSIILVEQNADLALRLAQYAYVLETGGIVLHGKTRELIDNVYVEKAYLGD